MHSRRKFLRDTVHAGSLVPFASLPSEWHKWYKTQQITILHTNDVHSRIEPFPMDGGRNQGLGGAARRATLIDQIRQEEEHVLLLDCGDIFQGTPYFNVFEGELEMKLMSEMNYDAATMGNHDFDAGIDGFNTQLKNSNFPFIVSNYDFSDTILNGKTREYKEFDKGDIKIGVYGLGIQLEGLVPETLYKATRYENPITKARYFEKLLKYDHKCDLIIAISHLGYQYRDAKVSDVILAKNTKETDIILGGHTHTFLREPVQEKNLNDQPVLINQVGWAGIMMGRLDIYFHKKKRKKSCEKKML